MVERKRPFLLGAPEPDWTNADDYPDPSSANMEVWAEEFMLRNPEVKKMRAAIEAFARQGPPPEDPGSELVCGVPAPLDRFYATLNNAVAGLLQQFAPKRWAQSIRPADTQSEIAPDTVYCFAPTTTPADVLIRFNPEYPTEPQLEAARALIDSERKALASDTAITPVKNRPLVAKVEKYRLYLRLLDAEAAGAETSHMAQILFPEKPNTYPEYDGNHAVRDGLKAARRLRDGDYRNLPLLEK